MLPTANSEPNFEFMANFMREIENTKIEVHKAHVRNRLEILSAFSEVPSLKEKRWSSFFIEDVAEIVSGKDIYEADRVCGNAPYITATANNNGIGYWVGNKNSTFESGCLSVNRNGSVGYSFYHRYGALFSNDCRKLRLKCKSEFVGLFISRVITNQREKYGYGYKMGTARLKRQKILLPVNDNFEPDYEFMENYMKKLEFEKLISSK